ncbi:hypothetical protein BJV78DRAFT_588221 [Lactifluus subvellereus]|nr:hypothetical protein BJV78DRAFT_588221 [Lactifluus subvellereus]
MDRRGYALSVGLPVGIHMLRLGGCSPSMSENIKYHGSARAPRSHEVSAVSSTTTEEQHVGALSWLLKSECLSAGDWLSCAGAIFGDTGATGTKRIMRMCHNTANYGRRNTTGASSAVLYIFFRLLPHPYIGKVRYVLRPARRGVAADGQYDCLCSEKL